MENTKYDIKKFSMEYFNTYLTLLNEVIAEGKWLARNKPFDYKDSVEYIKNKCLIGVPFLLLFDNNKLIGWCDADPTKDNAGYLAIGLHKDYRGKGIGKILMRNLIDESISFGYKQLILSVRATNERAIALYSKMGFNQTQYIANGLILGNEKIDVIKMTLNLT